MRAPRSQAPHLVLFDLDNTLVDRAGGFTIWARRFLARRPTADPSDLAWLEDLDNDGLTSRPKFFAEVRERYSLREPIEELVSTYGNEYPTCIPALPAETRSALDELRASGWRIGIVTNGAPTQEVKITTTGLDELVDGWVISEVIGSRKPDAAIFHAAAAACACPIDGGWMVGDSASADIAGASAVGLSTVWISRGRSWAEPTYEPDAVADSVAEAASTILRAGSRSAGP